MSRLLVTTECHTNVTRDSISYVLGQKLNRVLNSKSQDLQCGVERSRQILSDCGELNKSSEEL